MKDIAVVGKLIERGKTKTWDNRSIRHFILSCGEKANMMEFAIMSPKELNNFKPFKEGDLLKVIFSINTGPYIDKDGKDRCYTFLKALSTTLVQRKDLNVMKVTYNASMEKIKKSYSKAYQSERLEKRADELLNKSPLRKV